MMRGSNDILSGERKRLPFIVRVKVAKWNLFVDKAKHCMVEWTGCTLHALCIQNIHPYYH